MEPLSMFKAADLNDINRGLKEREIWPTEIVSITWNSDDKCYDVFYLPSETIGI